ncbi:glycine--tRNA ligase subunit beta [Roseococcus sp. DSY-14]|uniref:glycine--tRNA ligase subunit beta n=1 Tax=Roseococcus sp. DSY-14 TaxID=3369650 RepID=UPI00387B42E5
MPELLIELLSEEIPARMQARAAEDLARLCKAALAPLMEGEPQGFAGPRRIGLVARMQASAATAAKEERGPRIGAPEAALAGFLKKHGAAREDLREENGFHVLAKPGETVTAEALLHARLPDLLWSFPWPKSMRWGTSGFTWVRPLQRMLVLLGGVAVPVSLARNGDDAHGLVAGDLTEGHRVHAPGAVRVASAGDHAATLRARFVLRDAAERMAAIRDGVTALAAAEGLEVVPDEGLLAEVAGLVEWPVPLLGRIDDAFMDLPAEVMRTSMRVNQRYFALRHPDGRPANRFALVANIAASDGGAALVAGNERVLRARLSDARFFWDGDLKAGLESFLPKLAGATFHAQLGTQADRVQRITALAKHLAPQVGADAALAEQAARLCKADLASGMVGEFPELQGIMGGHYARAAGLDARVADAIAQHYRPLGPTDAVPAEPVAVAVALADKLDTLAGFFAIGEKPTGSGDPYALRRAALGVIRIVRENGLRLGLKDAFYEARMNLAQVVPAALDTWRSDTADLLAFLLERLRVQLRAEGARHDLVAASIGEDDDITRILARAEALRAIVETPEGADLLAAVKRAGNILRIEEKKDGHPHDAPVDPALLEAPEEQALNAALGAAEAASARAMAAEDFAAATGALATLRAPLDSFFDKVVVNAEAPALRANRLRLLNRVRAAAAQLADLAKIEA